MALYHHLKISHQGDVCIVRFTESHLVNSMGEELEQDFQTVATLENASKVLVNFTGVGFITSGLFGKLLLLNRRLKQQGGRLTLCEMTPQIRAVFSTMKLERVLDILETESDALAILEV